MRGCGCLLGIVVSMCGCGLGISAPSSKLCVTFSRLVDTCQLRLDQDLALVATFDTDTDTLNGQKLPDAQHMRVTINGVEIDFLLAHNVSLPTGILRVTGQRPLGVLASGRVTIGNHATIDLSAGGAGARATCTNGPAMGGNSNRGGGGGGGGGFGAFGGAGGMGNAGGSGGGAGGQASPMPTGLIGGCAGAQGGHGDGGAQGGPRGLGGGALYVAAGVSITLGDGANINAGGGSGHRGNSTKDGGGGGGSGGMIFLESAEVSAATSTLAANGGGGGGGGGNDLNAGGEDGADGQASQAIAGASSGSSGGNGGNGGHTAGFDVGGMLAGAGGGGGGSVGFIRVLSAHPSLGTVSPAAIMQ